MEQGGIKKKIEAFEEKKKTPQYKKAVMIITIVAFVLLIAGLTYMFIPLIKLLRSEDGMQAVGEKLDSYNGFLTVIIFVLLQAVQVIVAVVPPVQVIGGLLFGWFFGTVLSYTGILLGNLAIFLIVRKFGTPIVEAFVKEEHLKKFKFLQDERKLTGILMLLYLIPGMPKDVLSYIVPLTKVDRRDFFMYVMPCRLPAILMSTVLGSNVITGNYKAVIIVAVLTVLIALAGFFFKDKALNRIRSRRKHNDKTE